MLARPALTYDDDAPVQTLGQFSAWRLRGAAGAPFDMIWISMARDRSPHAHRVLPHGEPSVAILRRRARCGDISEIVLTVCGPYRRPVWYRPRPREELIAVRLHPETAADIFGVAPREYCDSPLAAAPEALRAACAGALRLAETESHHRVACALAGDLHRFAAPRARQSRPEMAAASIMRRTQGRIGAKRMAQHLEVSERHLRRRFQDSLGCTPKAYARILRLTAAALSAETTARPAWADIAAGAGYHDQAHMINEFRALLEMTPRQLHAERRGLSAFCNTGSAA